jgi:hypothetical protein
MRSIEERLDMERIPASMRAGVEAYARLVADLAGDNVVALTFFGAVVAAGYDPERGPARNVLMLDKVDLDLLRRVAERGVQIGKLNIAAPVVMTEGYLAASLDSFPIEMIEIAQMRATVLGEDKFGGLRFDEGHVRLACEREFKRVLIGLRQGLLSAAGRERVLAAVEMDVGEVVLRTIRAVLWMKGMKESKPKEEALSEVERLVGRRLEGLRASLDPVVEHDFAAFEKLYGDVEALAEVADAG